MTAKLKNIVLATPIALVLTFTSITPAFAASPDGNGPWADSVLSATQGLRKDGSAVPAIRSDASSALGVAEDNTTDGNFYSLGFGGSIALGFDNGISTGVIVVEATGLPYPTETASVEVSENGTTWDPAGNVSADGQVNKPESISCAKYVRITDTSNKDNFSDSTADGYDVDGVKASGEPCTPPTPTPTPGGNCGSKDCCATTVKQVNNATITNTVGVTQNTGNNSANKNTDGSVNVVSGEATATVGIINTTGSNVAVIDPCCAKGSTDVTIKDNGAASKNTVKINSKAKEKVKPVSKKK